MRFQALEGIGSSAIAYEECPRGASFAAIFTSRFSVLRLGWNDRENHLDDFEKGLSP
jgi:hypothetical protein